MASTTYTDKVGPPISAAWLNDVNSLTYGLFDGVTTAVDARATLGIEAAEVDVASAATCNIGAAASMNVRITGTTGITSFGSSPAGTIRRVRHSAAALLTHNGTSLILPGAADITTAAGDTYEAESLGSGNWVVRAYQKASGLAIVTQPVTILRSYLAGLTLSTAGGSTTISVAAGQAADSTNAVMMSIAAFSKTTASFVAGSGNGALDTGASGGSTSTWYHLWLIAKADGTADILMSLSATSPTMPATYTYKRRIGSAKLDGSKNWIAFIQDGDYFRWLVGAYDIGDTNPGTGAVLRTLTVPPGINVFALFSADVADTSGAAILAYFSDPASTDTAPSPTSTAIGQVGNPPTSYAYGYGTLSIRTNTSAQVRSRLSVSGAGTTINMCTHGWIDSRGRNA